MKTVAIQLAMKQAKTPVAEESSQSMKRRLIREKKGQIKKWQKSDKNGKTRQKLSQSGKTQWRWQEKKEERKKAEGTAVASERFGAVVAPAAAEVPAGNRQHNTAANTAPLREQQ